MSKQCGPDVVQKACLEQVVAAYAPRGQRERRRQRTIRTSIMSGCLAVVAGSVLVTVYDLPVGDTLTALLPTNATGDISQSPADFDRERAEFRSMIAELERKIGSIAAQEEALEMRQAAFHAQGLEMARRIDEALSQQSDLENRRDAGSQLDREISAIAEQRQALQARWAQFEAQGELLALEIVAVNAQRKELEAQRRQIDSQQRRLAEMLEKADEFYRGGAGAEAMMTEPASSTVSADEYTLNDYSNDLLVVDNSQLDAMRGGFSVGDGLDVSFGFTRTGAINGVEQFRSGFEVDSLAGGFDNVDMSNMGSSLLQNGTGNFVTSGALDALSRNFGNVIQNTVDDQVISTTTIFDISLHNVPGAVQGMHGEQAMLDSLASFR